MSKPNIVLIVSGGLVQAAYADGEVGEITVLDSDTEGARPGETAVVDGHGYYLGSPGEAVIDPGFVQRSMKAIDEYYGE